MHAATSKVENLAQGLSCKLKFVHGLSFICDITTILKLLMNIIEIVVNCYDLYDDLPTNIVVMSQFAHSSNQGI